MISKYIPVALILLILLIIPALGELSEYQKGVFDGLKAGMRMGILLGAAPFDQNQAQIYNGQVDEFNQGLSAVFEGNKSTLDLFWLKPYGYAALNPIVISRRPVHSIDASWNNTTRFLGDQDIGKRIYDMPASAYYTWVGNAPDLPYSGAVDSNGKIINYDSLGGV